MSVSSRLAGLAVVLLLAACSSQAPLPPSAGSSLPPVSAEAEDVLIRAIGLVGTPYRWGGNTPEGGFDCSGLIGYVYRDAAGLQLPRTTREMSALRVPRVPRQQLRSGDLVFFATSGGGRVSHAGIYVGEGRFVHAPSTGGTVRLDSLSNGYWQKSYLDARRVLGGARLARNP
ncbi:Cell wall-associated hydrolases (invasion-associated proteins) [Pseudomonas sp. OF001]|jgi:cell wall-associated NlpC family hydrolase|uniref:C40 family peptidase n=1 Tax=Pseudomonas sp. OF001 TaxID=2772300 RepID=UPI001919CF39|nr:C40 family peptidase [Pseudomonas sp. OF001]CAD5377275.1 Cell wall-associated hydrolases (invasion-associated proteins) [Pseudomonas sp. OF001]